MKGSALLSFLLTGYGLLWRAARPALRRHKRLRDDFAPRLAPQEWRPCGPEGSLGGVDLWLQAASGGEAFLARQLLGELHARSLSEPQQKLRILCTSCTRQGLDVLQSAAAHGASHWPGLDITVRVFPLDAPEIMRRAVALASPRAVVLLETELWPGLMAACAEKNIPMAVVNGRMTEKSLAGYRWLSSLWRAAAPKRVLAVSDADGARFAALFGADRVAVMPNMKFDGIPETPPATNPASCAAALLPPGAPVVLFASVRREEEPLLQPAIAYLRKHAPEALLVVAPRHMERVAAWMERLNACSDSGVSVLRSDLEARGKTAKPGGLVVWDRFGELTALYARADAVFVGGSLAPLGGQNFLEPAGQGKVPAVGPHGKNFAWVGEAFFDAGLAVRVPDAEALGPALLRLLREAPCPDTIREKTAAYVAPRRGGTVRAAAMIRLLLEETQG